MRNEGLCRLVTEAASIDAGCPALALAVADLALEARKDWDPKQWHNAFNRVNTLASACNDVLLLADEKKREGGRIMRERRAALARLDAASVEADTQYEDGRRMVNHWICIGANALAVQKECAAISERLGR